LLAKQRRRNERLASYKDDDISELKTCLMATKVPETAAIADAADSSSDSSESSDSSSGSNSDNTSDSADDDEEDESRPLTHELGTAFAMGDASPKRPFANKEGNRFGQ
jgi:hypothetical protein